MGTEPNLNGTRLLIFDLDGTLIDSEADLVQSVNAVRTWMGLDPLPEKLVATYVGRGVPVLMRRALGEDASEEDIARGVDYFLQFYQEHMLDHTVPYPGVREALERLNGRTLAVLTNKPVNFSRSILEGLRLAPYFSFVYGGNSFEHKKPHPVGVLRLMEETGASAAETLIVGDSDTDVLTGRNAGVKICGVTYGIGSHTLQNTPPDFLVDDLRELAGKLAARSSTS
jgi:phosphoglycolate phosphatase